MIYRHKSVAFATSVEGDQATAWSFFLGVLFCSAIWQQERNCGSPRNDTGIKCMSRDGYRLR